MDDETDFIDIVQSGDYLATLKAMRDKIAHDIDGNRCDRCHSTQMRTGELSSLYLRLKAVLDDIREADHTASGTSSPRTELPEGVASLNDIKRARGAPVGPTGTKATGTTGRGTKAAPRRSSPGRRNDKPRS